MRATIFPEAFILTNTCKAMVSIMTLGCTLPLALPLRWFLLSLPNYIFVYALTLHYYACIDRKGVLQREFSQTIFSSRHFLSVDSSCMSLINRNNRDVKGSAYLRKHCNIL